MKRGLILGLVLVVLIISACQQFPSFGGNKEGPKQTTFVGGTKGLEIAFAEDQPPDGVLDNGQEEFFITLLMKNEGEYSIPSGSVIGSLSGIVQSSFSIKNMDKKSSNEVFGTA